MLLLPFVTIRNLTKDYMRGNQVMPVLSEIDFDIYAGEYVALMGPSAPARPRCST